MNRPNLLPEESMASLDLARPAKKDDFHSAALDSMTTFGDVPVKEQKNMEDSISAMDLDFRSGKKRSVNSSSSGFDSMTTLVGNASIDFDYSKVKGKKIDTPTHDSVNEMSLTVFKNIGATIEENGEEEEEVKELPATARSKGGKMGREKANKMDKKLTNEKSKDENQLQLVTKEEQPNSTEYPKRGVSRRVSRVEIKVNALAKGFRKMGSNCSDDNTAPSSRNASSGSAMSDSFRNSVASGTRLDLEESGYDIQDELTEEDKGRKEHIKKLSSILYG